jgi:hypothetical protein
VSISHSGLIENLMLLFAGVSNVQWTGVRPKERGCGSSVSVC